MKVKHWLLTVLFLTVVSTALYGCTATQKPGSTTTPKALLDTYFSSAIKQDYAKVYTCYYKEYHTKITLGDYVKHRKEASLLKSYKIVSVKENGDRARAEVMLTFAPEKKFHRDRPVTVKTGEDLIRENGSWKVKVW